METTEHANLKAQIEECDRRINQLLESSHLLLTKALQLQKYIMKCHERMAKIEERNNGERSRKETKK